MADREIVMRGLWCCLHAGNCDKCPEADNLTYGTSGQCVENLIKMAYELIEGQHRLQVHNIGNVDIPEGVSEEDFHKVMNNVVDALEHTERGESWPYDTGCGEDFCEIGGNENEAD